MEPETHSRFPEALTLAASHFLNYTNDLSGEEILAYLEGTDEEFQSSRIRLWASLNEDREGVAELIRLLAEDFIKFLDKQ
jgi:hypothetical protein